MISFHLKFYLFWYFCRYNSDESDIQMLSATTYKSILAGAALDALARPLDYINYYNNYSSSDIGRNLDLLNRGIGFDYDGTEVFVFINNTL